MGMFSYLCSKCGLSVRGGEQAVLRHIRHGQLVGEARGTYDGYGRVEEDALYRHEFPKHPNDVDQLFRSEFELLDSLWFVSTARIYQGEPLTWINYRTAAVANGVGDLSPQMYAEWEGLPLYSEVYTDFPRSGIEAWHAYCFDHTNDEAKNQHHISVHDPNQSWGKPRKKYL